MSGKFPIVYTIRGCEACVRLLEKWNADGIEYEVVVRPKHYQQQSQIVAANMADVQKRLTFKLETSLPAKPGETK